MTSRPTAEIIAEIADLENRLREAQTALLDIQPCTCTDQVRSVIGTCPERGHREYSLCPKRKAAANATAPNLKED